MTCWREPAIWWWNQGQPGASETSTGRNTYGTEKGSSSRYNHDTSGLLESNQRGPVWQRTRDGRTRGTSQSFSRGDGHCSRMFIVVAGARPSLSGSSPVGGGRLPSSERPDCEWQMEPSPGPTHGPDSTADCPTVHGQRRSGPSPSARTEAKLRPRADQMTRSAGPVIWRRRPGPARGNRQGIGATLERTEQRQSIRTAKSSAAASHSRQLCPSPFGGRGATDSSGGDFAFSWAGIEPQNFSPTYPEATTAVGQRWSVVPRTTRVFHRPGRGTQAANRPTMSCPRPRQSPSS